MATLTIRKLDDSIKSSLRMQAAKHGVSMEEEVRCILRQALLQDENDTSIGSRIHKHFSRIGGVDENICPPRSMPRVLPEFSVDEQS